MTSTADATDWDTLIRVPEAPGPRRRRKARGVLRRFFKRSSESLAHKKLSRSVARQISVAKLHSENPGMYLDLPDGPADIPYLPETRYHDRKEKAKFSFNGGLPWASGRGAYHPYQVEKRVPGMLIRPDLERKARRAGRHWLHPDALGVAPGRVSWADMHNRLPYVPPDPYFKAGERDLISEMYGPTWRQRPKVGFLRARDLRGSLEGLIPGRVKRRAVGVIERFRQRTLQARAKTVARSALKAKVASVLRGLPAHVKSLQKPPPKRFPRRSVIAPSVLRRLRDAQMRARASEVTGRGGYKEQLANFKDPKKASFVRDWLPWVAGGAAAAASLPWTGPALARTVGPWLTKYVTGKINGIPDRLADAGVDRAVAAVRSRAEELSAIPEGEERAAAILAQLDAEAGGPAAVEMQPMSRPSWFRSRSRSPRARRPNIGRDRRVQDTIRAIAASYPDTEPAGLGPPLRQSAGGSIYERGRLAAAVGRAANAQRVSGVRVSPSEHYVDQTLYNNPFRVIQPLQTRSGINVPGGITSPLVPRSYE